MNKFWGDLTDISAKINNNERQYYISMIKYRQLNKEHSARYLWMRTDVFNIETNVFNDRDDIKQYSASEILGIALSKWYP